MLVLDDSRRRGQPAITVVSRFRRNKATLDAESPHPGNPRRSCTHDDPGSMLRPDDNPDTDCHASPLTPTPCHPAITHRTIVLCINGTYIPINIKGAGPLLPQGHPQPTHSHSRPPPSFPPTHSHSRPPPSFPRKREPRDGPGAGHSRTRQATQTTEKYRLWRFFQHDGSLRRVRKPAHLRHSRHPQSFPPPTAIPATHRHSRHPQSFPPTSVIPAHPQSFPPTSVIPAKAGIQGWARARGIPPPQQPTRQATQSTGNYRKLPALAIFPTRRIPSKSPETLSHRHSRESGNPGMGRARGIPAPDNHPNYRKVPETTGIYRL